MTAAQHTLDRLMQLTPVPISRVDWSSNWVNNPVAGHEDLSEMRLAVAKMLYAHPEVKEVRTLLDHVQSLDEYGTRLLGLVACKQLPGRRTPLAFDWAFKAETFCVPKELDTFENMMDMRSAYVGFEHLCVMVSACVLSFRRAHLLMDRDNLAGQAALGEACDLLDRTHRSFGSVLSPEQWSCLRVQGLPMQMQRGWVAFFRDYAKYQLHALRETQVDLFKAKVLAQDCLRSATQWLLDPCVTAAQMPVVQTAYDAVCATYMRHNVVWHHDEAVFAEQAGNVPVAIAVNQKAVDLVSSLDDNDRLQLSQVASDCVRSQDVLRQMQALPATQSEVDKWFLSRNYDLVYCK
jgi:hypothetical protein